MRRHAIEAMGSVLIAGVILLWTGGAQAYDLYSGSQCETCHSSFVDRNQLHDSHVAISGNCGMCHPSNPGSKPVSTSSASDGSTFSCLGCHGRDYGGTTGLQAAGLRLVHENANPPVSCLGCHPGDPTPLGEDIAPPHYGRGDVTLTESCSDNLDTDGDSLVDGADTDCAGSPVELTTWGRIKALFE